MANNTESSSAGLKRRRSNSKEPVPLPIDSHSNLDSTIESILRKKVRERLDIEKIQTSLLARIKVLERNAAAGTLPSGLRIQSVRTKGQDAETLQAKPYAKFDEVIREAEQKLLDAVITHLRYNVEESKKAIQEREEDIDGTIAQWKSYLQKSKEITSGQVDSLVEAAVKVSSDSAVARASKALQKEINGKETTKRESMDSSEAFVPSEQSIREIIRQKIHRTQDLHLATNNHQRKVSFSNSPGRKSRSTHQQPTKKQQQQQRSKSPRANSSKQVNRPRSSAKNAKGKGSGPAK